MKRGALMRIDRQESPAAYVSTAAGATRFGPVGGEGCAVAAAPATGRRASHRHWRPSTAVELAVPGDPGVGVTGRLLNLSEDGLACLVSSDAVAMLAASGQVRCSLGLVGAAARLTLAARVAHVSDASEPGYSRVGLDFTRDSRNAEARRRVCEALVHAPF